MRPTDSLHAGRRAEWRDHHVALRVTCPACGKTSSLTPRQRNDPKYPGKHCDGEFGARHGLATMLGPEGKAYE